MKSMPVYGHHELWAEVKEQGTVTILAFLNSVHPLAGKGGSRDVKLLENQWIGVARSGK
jgi:hypothetical protein